MKKSLPANEVPDVLFRLILFVFAMCIEALKCFFPATAVRVTVHGSLGVKYDLAALVRSSAVVLLWNLISILTSLNTLVLTRTHPVLCLSRSSGKWEGRAEGRIKRKVGLFGF